MSFDHEMAKLIQRYLKDNGQDYTINEILLRPRWKRVWYWWLALEKYEGKPMPKDISIDECRKIYGDD